MFAGPTRHVRFHRYSSMIASPRQREAALALRGVDDKDGIEKRQAVSSSLKLWTPVRGRVRDRGIVGLVRNPSSVPRFPTEGVVDFQSMTHSSRPLRLGWRLGD